MRVVFLLLGFTLLSACIIGNKNAGSSIISGKIAVINEYGKDITQYCRKAIKRGGAFVQSADVGDVSLGQITCINNYEVYRIKGDRLTVNVPQENSHVYFGDITIQLIEDASYKVSSGNGTLKIGNTDRGWSKYDIGDYNR